jgi:hypothetical protein
VAGFFMEKDMTEDDHLATAPAPYGAPAETEPSEIPDTADEASSWDESEADEEGGADEPEADEDGEPRRKKASRSERLRRRAQALSAENEDLRRRLSAGGQSEIFAGLEMGPPPQEQDFGDDVFAYERARAVWEAERRMVLREARQRFRATESRQAEVMRETAAVYTERENEVRTRIPDYDEVLTTSGVGVTNAVKALILESDKGPLIAYHLARSPRLAHELNAVSEREAARRIGRLEARLTLDPNAQTRTAPPVTLLRGGASPSPDPSRMTMAEYAAWRGRGGG